MTINNEGRIWFSGYNFGCGGERYEKPEVRISKLISRRQISCLEQSQRYFSNEYTEIFATDIGDWVMELTNTEGVTYKFRGSLCADFGL